MLLKMWVKIRLKSLWFPGHEMKRVGNFSDSFHYIHLSLKARNIAFMGS